MCQFVMIFIKMPVCFEIIAQKKRNKNKKLSKSLYIVAIIIT